MGKIACFALVFIISFLSKVLPTNLCGTLTGQHVYLSVSNSTTITLSIALTSVGAQQWRILVRQFESSQTNYLAPRGCLQYFRYRQFDTIYKC